MRRDGWFHALYNFKITNCRHRSRYSVAFDLVFLNMHLIVVIVFQAESCLA